MGGMSAWNGGRSFVLFASFVILDGQGTAKDVNIFLRNFYLFVRKSYVWAEMLIQRIVMSPEVADKIKCKHGLDPIVAKNVLEGINYIEKAGGGIIWQSDCALPDT